MHVDQAFSETAPSDLPTGAEGFGALGTDGPTMTAILVRRFHDVAPPRWSYPARRDSVTPPKAIQVLEDHLDEGGAQAARAALQVLSHAWGRPAEHLTIAPALAEGADLRMLSDAE